jgi:tRNA threonylcarbamoyladenosine biosynthesis protein TsaE
MSTGVTLQIDCTSLEQSLALAARLGKNLQGGEVIELVSDLGGGKTTFVRGLARGIASPDHVSSPTFTLNNVYVGEKLQLHHYDFYRLQDAGILRDELAEVLSDPKAVTVVEWAEIVHDVLPADKLTITITATGETARRYDLLATDQVKYLLEDIS